MRAFVRLIDAAVRRARGVFPFCEDEECLLRLQLSRAGHELRFSGCRVPPGAPVLELHLWNEHVPQLPASGPDLAWAMRMRRLFLHSLRAVARKMENDPRLVSVSAVCGATGLLSLDGGSSGVAVFQRLGFTVLPNHHPLGRFGEFWDNLYAWWLMWTFNPVSRRSRRFSDLQRVEIWMPAEEFLSRYGNS
ncbi:MAG: hypothetical protein A2Z45_05075 [Chloroflexi bacterium RBG_19FT_COMBO_55_16]|nr:MAG: hypothetical protein A2Z45_05075 [Chloroflexi bacterium RBG_19FT_COMBO_55_16]